MAPPGWLKGRKECARLLAWGYASPRTLQSQGVLGSQSLHTTVVPLGSDELFPLEVHIRTGAMHRLAQYGIAGESWMTSFRKGSGSSTSTAASDPGPQSPTEAELAPISSQVRPH